MGLRALTIITIISSLITLPALARNEVKQAAKIAVIIDDLGNSRSDLDAALLPGKITFAVLPFTPHSRSFALRAHHQGKQIMLHAPMQAIRGNRLGPGALTTEMSSAEIKLTLQRALDDVPYVAGVNNHMGSYFTQVEAPMRAVLETLQRQRLFFIDSRTSEFSVAEHLAQELSVPSGHRHVFLDNEVTDEYLQGQWQQLIEHALDSGAAIAIGHPYPETMAFLRTAIPELNGLGIELVFASEIVTSPSSAGGLLKTSE